MPNVEGDGTHGSDKEGRTGVLGFSCQDWDRPVAWVLMDWEDTRQMRSLNSKNRRWGLTPGPELSQSQRGHDRVGDFRMSWPLVRTTLAAVNHPAPQGGNLTGH